MKRVVFCVASFLLLVMFIALTACSPAAVTQTVTLTETQMATRLVTVTVTAAAPAPATVILTKTATAAVAPQAAAPLVTLVAQAGFSDTEANIEIYSGGFKPSLTTLSPCIMVSWHNATRSSLTIVCDGLLEEVIPPGGYFYYTFDNLGTYGFYLKGNPGVQGVININ